MPVKTVIRTAELTRIVLLGTILACVAGKAAAVTCTSATTNGNWGTAGEWSCTSGGNHVPLAGEDVIIDRNFTVNVATNTVATVTINAGTLTQSSALTTSGALTIAAGTLTSTNTMTIGGATSITGTLNITSTTGTHTLTGAVTINIGGTWSNSGNEAVTFGNNLINNGTFNSGTGIYTFSGAAAQTITGTAGGTTTFSSLTLNNANGLSLTGTHDVTVAGLTLTSGRITTNANVLYISSGAAVGGAAAARFVVGNLRKRVIVGANIARAFEVGTETPAVRYTPVDNVQFGNVTVAGDFTVSTTVNDHPNLDSSTLDGTKSVNRYWTLTNNSVTFDASANNRFRFTFVAGDLDGGAVTGNFFVARYAGSLWLEHTPTTRTATTTQITGTGITSANVTGAYQIAEKKPAAQAYYIHTDHLNTPRLITNSTGQAVWRFDNTDPFGGNVPDENPSGLGTFTCNLRFTGTYADKETGLLYNWWRTLDPALGRYIQSDPIGLQGGINTYAYVLSNPLSNVDPKGLAVWLCNRKVQGFPYVGNHSYLWDDRISHACSMRGSAGVGGRDQAEQGPGGDSCVLIQGSVGKENEIMDCCQRSKNAGVWIPGINDCHNAANRCLRAAGLTSPGAPGGRLGECDSCFRKPGD